MAVAATALRVNGLRELQAALKAIDGEAQKELRGVLNDAAQVVVKHARPLMPVKTGTAAASLKVLSTQREARVKEGSAKAPYAPWLDYGGAVGRNRSVKRPFVKGGRYVYPAYYANQEAIDSMLSNALTELIKRHGLEVHSG